MQTETITALELFEQGLTKTVIKSMAQQAIESVKETGNVLKVAEAISAMEAFIKEVKADESFKEYAREEISKYPKGYTSNSGAKLECIEAGTKYDYSQCGDTVHAMYSQQLMSVQNSLKDREKFLQAVPLEGMLITDELTGETCKIYPPSKSSTSSYKITLAR